MQKYVILAAGATNWEALESRLNVLAAAGYEIFSVSVIGSSLVYTLQLKD